MSDWRDKLTPLVDENKRQLEYFSHGTVYEKIERPYEVYFLGSFGWGIRRFMTAHSARLFRNAKWDQGMKAFMAKHGKICK